MSHIKTISNNKKSNQLQALLACLDLVYSSQIFVKTNTAVQKKKKKKNTVVQLGFKFKLIYSPITIMQDNHYKLDI